MNADYCHIIINILSYLFLKLINVTFQMSFSKPPSIMLIQTILNHIEWGEKSIPSLLQN